MSKLRQNIPASNGDLDVPATGDLKPYVVFTQLKQGGPFIYAGWLDAKDDAMALDFAKEHYGQDQECVNVQVISRDHVTSNDGLYTSTSKHTGPFNVYTQKRRGDLWISAGEVDAQTPDAAIKEARSSVKQAKKAHAIWVIAQENIISTDGEMIWRFTDQSYRLARGYGREVRAKWIAFRDEKQLAEYEKDDLKDSF